MNSLADWFCRLLDKVPVLSDSVGVVGFGHDVMIMI
jgi:hypothetical protein